MKNAKTQGSPTQVFTVAQSTELDLICLSHLRWDYVTQRPQHLMSRWSQGRRVFFVEEAEFVPGENQLGVRQHASGVRVITPYLNDKINTRDEYLGSLEALLSQLLVKHRLEKYILWFYSPMAVPYTRHCKPELVIYDCMDELSAFKGAPSVLKDYEAELLERADLVFTGGKSLYEVKRNRHPNVYLFPSSIDTAHFEKARKRIKDPADQAGIPHPRLGYFGVLDERMDISLLVGLAEARPNWHLVMIGPVTKIEEENLPRLSNIHYLGQKDYDDLPAYLAGWDVAILPFAMNEHTLNLSPTKIPEYLAGGKPVVSTPIRDVVRTYLQDGLVWVAENLGKFILAVESAMKMNGQKEDWLLRVDQFLAKNSWDETWLSMQQLVQAELAKKRDSSIMNLSLEQPPTISQSYSLPTLPFTNGGRDRRNGGSKEFDYLIVGAGFAGSVLAERLAAGSGKRVLIIDRRSHIAGNAYDHYDSAGVLIHKYGPHIFHTNSRDVFAYLSRFTHWRQYEHRVLASVDGQLVPMPINLDTINRLYGLNLTSFELEKFFESVAEPTDKVITSEDVVVSKIGRQLYEKFFRNYTRKQWDLDPSELDASVTSRVPIRLNRDDRYFGDVYQAMPLHGFTRLFENLLDHPNIKVMLNTDYREIVDLIPYREMIFTGPVDEYFNYCYGKLPYRSLQFRFETLDKQIHQPVAVINYPNEHPYTRVTEFKFLTGQDHPRTTLVYEYPCSEGDPYYPIPRPENSELYKKYRQLAEATEGVYFAGRLGTYRYYNMDQVVAQALTLYAKISGAQRSESVITYAPNRFTIEIPCTLLAPQGGE